MKGAINGQEEREERKGEERRGEASSFNARHFLHPEIDREKRERRDRIDRSVPKIESFIEGRRRGKQRVSLSLFPHKSLIINSVIRRERG